MNRSALADKQMPPWELEDIEPTSPSQTQPGPSDLLARAHPYTTTLLASIIGATQNPTLRSYQPTRSQVAQGPVRVPFLLEKPARPAAHIYGTITSQPITLERVSTPGRYGISDFSFNIRSASDEGGELWLVPTTEVLGPSSFQFEPAAIATSSPAENLQNRYKELSSKRYVESLTSDENLELQHIEEQLDELDRHDTHLQMFAGQIDEGYSKLRRGLTEINSILDELLRH